MIKTKEKLTVLFIGKSMGSKAAIRVSQVEADATSPIPIEFSIFTKEATTPGSNIAKTLKTSYCHIRAVHGYIGGNVIAPE